MGIQDHHFFWTPQVALSMETRLPWLDEKVLKNYGIRIQTAFTFPVTEKEGDPSFENFIFSLSIGGFIFEDDHYGTLFKAKPRE